ncbi:MAG: YbaB/EbfC family nucleoid-associated protein [Bacteroidetes bacterium]|jgi:DNA-binding YbaB/EbfC family protein|nr:YbaB/EbfC family nucleoid-associated protein [Bacteroidota bacterium]
MNIADMFGKMQEMQQRLEEAKKKLADITVEGMAGGGMVRVTANAARQILHVQLEADVLQDKEMLEDLIAAATNNALEKAEQAARQEMSKITQGMLPNIPGLDISQLGL